MAYGLLGAERVFFSSVLFQEAKENHNLWDCPQKLDRCTCMFSGDVPTKPKKNQTKEQNKKLSTEGGGGGWLSAPTSLWSALSHLFPAMAKTMS